MRPEHTPLPIVKFVKRMVCSGVLAVSLIQVPGSLMAAELNGDLQCTELQETALSGTTQQPETKLSNLFTNLKQYLGIRYRFGGQSPEGFDCSGFVRFMFNKELDIKLPRSSNEMASVGARIDRSELRPGDLVFFKNSRNRINHVGIFIGNDTFIHSSLSKGITCDTLNASYYDKRYATAVRILDLQDDQLPEDFELHLDAIEESDSAS